MLTVATAGVITLAGAQSAQACQRCVGSPLECWATFENGFYSCYGYGDGCVEESACQDSDYSDSEAWKEYYCLRYSICMAE